MKSREVSFSVTLNSEEPKCQQYFTEELDFIETGRRFTRRYEEYIYERVIASSVEQVKREEDLSWHQVNGIHQQVYERKKKVNWGQVKRLGLDEIAKHKGHKKFVTVVSDLEKGELIEVIDSHQQEEIAEVLLQQPLEVREAVEEVSVDMWGGFPKLIEKVFPNAQIVVDRFHVMKAVNDNLNKIRKQVKFKSKSKRAKWLLLEKPKRLKRRGIGKIRGRFKTVKTFTKSLSA
ncbi:transposase [Baaleninema simplex]|uniref:transposase n=1 Tax=Baaleninema simplex TaxID=2862350 RepID=UPI00130E8645|nr:transposase [Baaleninema simplex]